jgi:hypothetical protein
MAIGKKGPLDVIRRLGDERFVTLWHAEHVGWIVRRKEGVKKRTEFATVDETDVADVHRPVRPDRPWVP